MHAGLIFEQVGQSDLVYGIWSGRMHALVNLDISVLLKPVDEANPEKYVNFRERMSHWARFVGRVH